MRIAEFVHNDSRGRDQISAQRLVLRARTTAKRITGLTGRALEIALHST